MCVGVFDSGMGGLTVLKSLIKKHPNNQYIYFGDTLNMPYGDKSKVELEKLSSNIVEFLISKQVDVIVIACGTVSSNCYSYLKEKFDIPIFDILTPTIRYLKYGNLKNPLVIATTMTIRSGIFDEISGLAKQECPLFVPLIENGKIDSSEMDEAIKLYLGDYKVDNLVFGCTHYPLLKERLKKYLGNINYINMGDILADNLDLKEDQFGLELYFSKKTENIQKLVLEMFGDYEIKEYVCQNYQK